MRQYAHLGLALVSLGACATPGLAKVYDFNAMKAERISPGMSRRFVIADKSTMAIYNLRKGVVVPFHAHDSEQSPFVLEGRLRVVVGGRAFDLRQGQLVVIRRLLRIRSRRRKTASSTIVSPTAQQLGR